MLKKLVFAFVIGITSSAIAQEEDLLANNHYRVIWFFVFGFPADGFGIWFAHGRWMTP